MKILFIIIPLLFLFTTTPVFSHSGGLDSNGGHNCNVGACAGTYHYHNGGNSGGNNGGYGISSFQLPAPKAIENGNYEYKTSNQGWCTYDVDVTWDKPSMATKYSIAASKYAGADPGPRMDTTDTSYTVKSLEKGTWYINVKAGNDYGWSPVVYWTVTLPEMSKSMSSQIIERDGEKYLNYSISCMDKVEGPQEFTNYLEINNYAPTGEVLLTYTDPTTISMKGYDKAGKMYEQSLDFTPVVAGITATDDNSTDSLIGFGVIVAFCLFVFNKTWNWITKALKN